MASLKYEAERVLKDIKALLDEAVKFEAEKEKLEREIVELKKDHAKEIADLTKK